MPYPRAREDGNLEFDIDTHTWHFSGCAYAPLFRFWPDSTNPDLDKEIFAHRLYNKPLYSLLHPDNHSCLPRITWSLRRILPVFFSSMGTTHWVTIMLTKTRNLLSLCASYFPLFLFYFIDNTTRQEVRALLYTCTKLWLTYMSLLSAVSTKGGS